LKKVILFQLSICLAIFSSIFHLFIHKSKTKGFQQFSQRIVSFWRPWNGMWEKRKPITNEVGQITGLVFSRIWVCNI
jgi:hypothetical protein